jgi:hypothetical protein
MLSLLGKSLPGVCSDHSVLRFSGFIVFPTFAVFKQALACVSSLAAMYST